MKPDYNSEEKKSRQQCVTPNDCKSYQQAIIDNIKSDPCTPVRPRRERKYRNCDHIHDNRRDDNAQTTALKRIVTRVWESHAVDVALGTSHSQPPKVFRDSNIWKTA